MRGTWSPGAAPGPLAAFRPSLQPARGFTLVELLVVGAILLIMATFVFPSAFGARGTAGTQADKAERDAARKAVGRFQGDFQIDVSYVGAGATPFTASQTSYTEATARYGLPLGCLLPRSTNDSRKPFATTVLCSAAPEDDGFAAGFFAYAAQANAADEAYYLDFAAKARLRRPGAPGGPAPGATFDLASKRFVPDFLERFPGSVAGVGGTGLKNNAGGPTPYTGSPEARWVIRLRAAPGASGPSADASSSRVELWKMGQDAQGNPTWQALAD